MLKSFLFWAKWFRPYAKRLLKKHGKTIIKELLSRVTLPAQIEELLTRLAADGLSPKELQTIKEILALVRRIDSKEAREAVAVLEKIVEFLS